MRSIMANSLHRCTHYARTKKCSCSITNSFTEAITRFKLIAGLADADIKQDILSKSDMSLEETVKAVEGKESGKVAKLKVGAQDAKVSTVKTNNLDTPTKTKRCWNCNRTGHRSSQAEREKSFPACGKKCDSCGKEGHYKACCKSGKRQSTAPTNNYRWTEMLQGWLEIGAGRREIHNPCGEQVFPYRGRTFGSS